MTYREKLRHPRWQRKRLEIFSRDDWRCTLCGNTELELHIHHLRYDKGKDPWDYNSADLTTDCAQCHHGIHYPEKFIHDEIPGIIIPWIHYDTGVYPGTVLAWTGSSAREDHPTKDVIWYFIHPLTGEEMGIDASCACLYKATGLKGTQFHEWIDECIAQHEEEFGPVHD